MLSANFKLRRTAAASRGFLATAWLLFSVSLFLFRQLSLPAALTLQVLHFQVVHFPPLCSFLVLHFPILHFQSSRPTSTICHGSYVFVSVCLSIGMIIQKVVDEFS